MNLTINGNEQELHFGIGFVRELDNVAGVNKNGIQLGMGLTLTMPSLKSYNPAALSNVIYAATVTNSPRPGLGDVDKYLESITSADEIERIFDEVNEEINKATMLQTALKNMQA